jgi:hypothetical protein
MLALATLLAFGSAPARADRCEGSLSGSAVGKFACVVTVTETEEGQALFAIEPKAPIAGVPSYAPGAFQLPPPVEAKTYTIDTIGPGRASVAAEGGTLYTATRTTGRRGEVTLTFKSLKRNPKAPGTWTAHGTYRAVLVPAGAGKSGEVVVEVRF